MTATIIDLPSPTPEQIAAARLAAGLSQAQAAELVGLSDRRGWWRAEAGHGLDPARWAMFLLATGQHPTLRILPR